MDDAVYLWFTQRRRLGEPISGPVLCEKALEFNKSLGGSGNFKASSGWLSNFKQRHGIRVLDIQGEKLSSDQAGALAFKADFANMIDIGKYNRDDIYNTEETGINWRALPRRSLASHQETSAPGL